MPMKRTIFATETYLLSHKNGCQTQGPPMLIKELMMMTMMMMRIVVMMMIVLKGLTTNGACDAFGRSEDSAPVS